MYSLSVKTSQGKLFSLTDSPDYIVYKIEGLEPPQASLITSVNTTIDGSVLNSARVESRNLVIYAAINGDIEKNRIRLYSLFPVKKTVEVFFKNGSRDVSISGTVEMIQCDLFAQRQVAQISILCTEPYFKSVAEFVSTFSDITALFEFPFSIPSAGVEFSAITPNVRKVIVNTGDVESGIIIQLHASGTVVNPTLYNITTGERFSLNVTMENTDTIIIDTNTRHKTITKIRNGVQSNILGLLRLDSDWLTLGAGENVYTYDCESGSNNLQIIFTTNQLFMGV